MPREIERYIIQPEDVLNEEEYQLLQRAQAGEIPCTWCDRPSTGSFYFFLEDGYQYKGVRLCCSDCGFDER
jgi:hypothetical protein